MRASVSRSRGIEPVLEQGQELVAHPVAQEYRIGVRGILAPAEAPRLEVPPDRAAREAEQGPDHVPVPGAHRAEARRSRPA